jgi:D-glycero-D-manno-heptose 1,7-bisphosphate phosphatase
MCCASGWSARCSGARGASLRPGLLLDRDGVLNEECEYLHDPKDLIVIPGAAEAVAAINRRQIPVVVVTNQAGIGRGMYGGSAYPAVNRAMAGVLAGASAHVDAWYFCPHHPDEDCACRKPRPGMLLAAAHDLDLDLARSVLVGDKPSDLAAARAVGAGTVLVRTGYGRQVEAELVAGQGMALVDHVADSLLAALPYLEGVLPPLAGQPWMPRP